MGAFQPELVDFLPWTMASEQVEQGLWLLSGFEVDDGVEESVILSLLTMAERDRYLGYRCPLRRYCFGLSRLLMRQVLSGYTQQAPLSQRFELTAHGKPVLVVDGQSKSPVYFNLSHSGRYILLYVSVLGDVGVDIESVASSRSIMSIARRFFSKTELLLLSSAGSEVDRQETFFEIWTAKEAVLKSVGLGLQGGLDSFSVVPVAGKLTCVPGLGGDWMPSTLAVRQVRPEPGIIAAYAGVHVMQGIGFYRVSVETLLAGFLG